MRKKGWLSVGFKIEVALCLISAAVQGQETADWSKTHQQAKVMLFDQQVPIGKAVSQVTANEPNDAQEAMFKLNILMRAGMSKEAVGAVNELKKLYLQIEPYQIEIIYYSACDEFKAWEAARAIVEAFADAISELTLENRLLKYFTESGWTFEQVDAWLADKPAGIDNYWVKERLRFNAERGSAGRLVSELLDTARANPTDTDGIVSFLDAISSIGPQEGLDLSWMADGVRSESAAKTERIAGLLRTLGRLELALTFYGQAAKMSLSGDEVAQLSMRQRIVTAEQVRAEFAVHVRESMAGCLLNLGRNAEAQKWMEEAAALRKENNLGLNAMLAGAVQEASGERTIEEQIKADEMLSAENPEYWQQRARYYQGRRDPNAQEESLLKGLALATPQVLPERRGKEDYRDWRSMLLSDYAGFLQRQKRDAEGATLLLQELRTAPADAESSKRAAHLLSFEFSAFVRADDPVLWDWLAKRTTWEYTEERLLRTMLGDSPGKIQEMGFGRADRTLKDPEKDLLAAEELAFGHHPTRAAVVGEIFNGSLTKRAIPLLIYAVENTDSNDVKATAQCNLFNAYVNAGDWKKAEALFPDVSSRLELPEGYCQIAVSAARSGDKADAMRLWKRAANFSPYYLNTLPTLAKSGLKQDLIQFYEEMQHTLPGSDIPAKAIKMLEQ